MDLPQISITSPNCWTYALYAMQQCALKENNTMHSTETRIQTSLDVDEVSSVLMEELDLRLTESIKKDSRYDCLSNSDMSMCVLVNLETSTKSSQVIKISSLSLNNDTADKIKDICNKRLKQEKAGKPILAATNRGGLALDYLGIVSDTLIRENYDPAVIEKVDYVVGQMNSTHPSGRLTIINGQPGTGKTFLIRGLMQSMTSHQIVILPSNLVASMSGPDFVRVLLDRKTNVYARGKMDGEPEDSFVIIIEDADDCLTTRTASNISAVSSLLNQADGIFGSMLDLRIIATTNAPTVEFDKAFTRPGRLCAHISLDALAPTHAQEIYERLTGKTKTYAGPRTLAQVYADASDNPFGYTDEKKVVGFNR